VYKIIKKGKFMMERVFNVCEICNRLSLRIPTERDIDLMRKHSADIWFELHICKECQKGV
jgi:uncharacterized protein with PIN domain